MSNDTNNLEKWKIKHSYHNSAYKRTAIQIRPFLENNCIKCVFNFVNDYKVAPFSGDKYGNKLAYFRVNMVDQFSAKCVS